MSLKSTTIELDNGERSRAIWASRSSTTEEIIAALEISSPRALLILNGGTADLDADLEAKLRITLDDELARLVKYDSITVITGGTDAGIFHLFGQGLACWGRTAPCIGVAVERLVTRPGKPEGEASLEPNHSHFVLVDGENWGDETETMYALAAELSKNCPSVAVFAGGGEIAIKEMLANVAQGRPMILLAGSGRAVDAVLAALDGHHTNDPKIVEIARSGNIIRHSISETEAALSDLVRRVLV